MKRKEKILVTALSLFNERGVSEVGVREIARALDISVGNLSYHFPKKEDILSELLARLRDRNNASYETYFAGPPSLSAFLSLIEEVFHHQFDNRGVVVGNPEIKKILQSHYDYASIRVKRRETFTSIFRQLVKTGEMQLSKDQLNHLIGIITLLGRFWIHEAFLDYDRPTKAELIPRYLKLLSQQLALFATEKGKASLEKFWGSPEHFPVRGL